MKISIFGMGYVGVVSGACLLRDGYEVIGVDSVVTKVNDLAQGKSPIQEPGVAELLEEGHRNGRLTATTDPVTGLAGSDMVWICVGTPSASDNGIDFSSVDAAIEQIGNVVRQRSDRPLIVVRSTCLPGSIHGRVIPLLERITGLIVGKDIDLVFHPEFLREGTAIKDFDNPPKIVIGEIRPGAADKLLKIYKKYKAPHFCLKVEEAEMVKYCDNLFHALKITFANEVGLIAKSIGVDSRRIADVYCADTKLNISPAYLQPGFAYGGSCLPKDLRAILRLTSLKSLRLPMLESLAESNNTQVNNLILRILAYQPVSAGMIGLAFKPGTDDMRESPYVKVAKAMIGEGINLRIYDPAVHPDRLIGSNKQQILNALRHLEKLLVESLRELSTMDLIIINHPIVDAGVVHRWLDRGIQVLDLVGIEGVDCHAEKYEGLYW